MQSIATQIMLHHFLRVQYRIIAWGGAASCHIHLIPVVLSRAMWTHTTKRYLHSWSEQIHA